MSSPATATTAATLLQTMLLQDAALLNTNVQALVNAANDKVIAANGDVNVAIAAYSSVAITAPLQAPTLIPQLLLQGALTFKALLALLNADIKAKLNQVG